MYEAVTKKKTPAERKEPLVWRGPGGGERQGEDIHSINKKGQTGGKGRELGILPYFKSSREGGGGGLPI